MSGGEWMTSEGREKAGEWEQFSEAVREFVSAVQSSAVWIAVVVVVGLLVLVGLWWASKRMITKQLASRVTVELLPSEEFEVGLDQVVKIAKRWSQVRPAGRRMINWRWRPASAHAVRVSLVTDREGQLRYRVTVPAAEANLVTKVSYPGVEVRVIDPRTGDDEDIPTLQAWRAEQGIGATQHGAGGELGAAS